VTRLLIVRHGETDWNAEARVQGHSDVPLNEAGRRQARLAAAALRDEPLAAVYASDLARAAETGRILAEPHGLDVTLTPNLRERFWGDWQGRTLGEIERTDAGLFGRMRAGEWVTPEHAEGYEALQERVVSEIRRIAEKHDGETALVATHGGPVKAFVTWILGAPVSAHNAMRTGNAAITTVFLRHGRFVLETYNATGHLLVPDTETSPVENPGKAIIESAF